MNGNDMGKKVPAKTWVCQQPGFVKASILDHWTIPDDQKRAVAPGSRLNGYVIGGYGENLELENASLDGEMLPKDFKFIHLYEWADASALAAPLNTALEAVRLVIWDLDETFWRGTVTEGGIIYQKMHHDTVIELARRGIMSSICSKNDFGQIKQILSDYGLWEYFIFPSINWDPKGPRLAELVEAIQLRPSTILFIDDNPLNLNEAKHFVPGLLTSDETIISELLYHPTCQGKEDSRLTRLNQYKLLEKRYKQKKVSVDNHSFLRASNIRVTIEHGVEQHFDRISELINRTNQLNFTKKRISEDTYLGRQEIGAMLYDFSVHAGLIHVQDQFGDYGFVGFYLVRSYANEDRLIHFCFSCRTLGMGIESWVYDRLGRPAIDIVGPVLTDLNDPDRPVIDWINNDGTDERETAPRLSHRLFLRGGCYMSGTAHYLALNTENVFGEFNIVRNDLSLRLDHSSFLRLAFEGLSLEAQAAVSRLGYLPSDFSSALADNLNDFDVCIFNFHSDADYSVYKHPTLGFKIPFYEAGDITANAKENCFHNGLLQTYQKVLVEDGYEWQPPSATILIENLGIVLPRIPETKILVFLLSPESLINKDGVDEPLDRYIKLNHAIRDLTTNRSNVYFLDLMEFVLHPHERLTYLHFSRMVHFRMSQKIIEILGKIPT